MKKGQDELRGETEWLGLLGSGWILLFRFYIFFENLLGIFKDRSHSQRYDVIHLGSKLGAGILERSLGDSNVRQGRVTEVSLPGVLGFTLISLQEDQMWGGLFSALDAQRNHWAIFEWTCTWPPPEPIKSGSMVVIPGH